MIETVLGEGRGGSEGRGVGMRRLDTAPDLITKSPGGTTRTLAFLDLGPGGHHRRGDLAFDLPAEVAQDRLRTLQDGVLERLASR